LPESLKGRKERKGGTRRRARRGVLARGRGGGEPLEQLVGRRVRGGKESEKQVLSYSLAFRQDPGKTRI